MTADASAAPSQLNENDRPQQSASQRPTGPWLPNASSSR